MPREYGNMDQYQQEVGGRKNTSITMPEGMEAFSVTEKGPKVLSFYPYKVKVTTQYATAGQWWPNKDFWIHRMPPIFVPYCCPQRNWNRRCPFCETAERLKAEGRRDEVKDYVAKFRQLWLVEDVAAKKGVQLWDVPWVYFGKPLLKHLELAVQGTEKKQKYFWRPEKKEGYLVRIGFAEAQWKVQGKAGFEAVTFQFRPRTEDIPDEVLAKMPCLDDLLIEPTYDFLRSLLQSPPTKEDDGPNEEELDALANMETPWDGPEKETPQQPKRKSKSAEPVEASAKQDGWDQEDWG